MVTLHVWRVPKLIYSIFYNLERLLELIFVGLLSKHSFREAIGDAQTAACYFLFPWMNTLLHIAYVSR